MSIRRFWVSGLYSVVVTCLLGVSGAGAATLNVVGGQLVGASGVDVDGSLYDVAFVDGSCISIYDGCNESADFTFQNLGDAALAAQALLDQVFLNDVEGLFDTTPSLTAGCSTGECRALTPYNVAGGSADYVQAINYTSPGLADSISLGAVPNTLDFTPIAHLVYANWTAVPEPGTALLMGLGLAGLSVRSRSDA